jgi:ribose/xylose/arabinose/galactoside ABC-type transport system permease subunit
VASALRYLDLLLLLAALPVFLAADLSMAGYLTVAGIWLVMYAVEFGANRAIAGAVERRDRRAAMGWLGASSLAQAWIVALAVLVVGLAAGKHAGLAAAVLALVLFTVHLGTRVLLRLLSQGDDRARTG